MNTQKIDLNHCPHCRVDVRTPAAHCPLCQGVLDHRDGGPQVQAEYPDIPLEMQRRRYLLPIFGLITLLAAGVCLLINALIPAGGRWSWIVVGSLLFTWVLVRSIIQRQNSLMSLSTGILPASALLILIDALYGFRRWSTNYVVPALCLSAILTVFLISLIRGMQPQDFVIYIIITSVMALIPVAFLLTNLATINWPSLVCVLFGALSLLLVLLLSTQDMRDELRRRFHL